MLNVTDAKYDAGEICTLYRQCEGSKAAQQAGMDVSQAAVTHIMTLYNTLILVAPAGDALWGKKLGSMTKMKKKTKQAQQRRIFNDLL